MSQFVAALKAIPNGCWICQKKECNQETCACFQKAIKKSPVLNMVKFEPKRLARTEQNTPPNEARIRGVI